jgi:hypothetical protein
MDYNFNPILIITLISICLIYFITLYFNNENNNISFTNFNKENTNIIYKYLNGCWSSNLDFNELSDIDNMLLYINNNDCKLLIYKDNEIINNSDFNFKISDINKIDSNSNFDYQFKLYCYSLIETIDDCDELIDTNENVWDNIEFDAMLSINNGNIKLFNKDTLYADLIKDNMLSNSLN